MIETYNFVPLLHAPTLRVLNPYLINALDLFAWLDFIIKDKNSELDNIFGFVHTFVSLNERVKLSSTNGNTFERVDFDT